MNRKLQLTRYACYASAVTMSVVSSLSPLLFLTFHQLYGISYTLLGSLVLVNFFTQLSIDLIFSFWSHRFNIPLVLRVMPMIAVTGLCVYSILPVLFPSRIYLFLIIGTVIFSSAAGLSEVLLSPIIAELPSEDPERDMSAFHSVYAWGVVAVVLLSTLFLHFIGRSFWYVLALLWALLPFCAFLLFCFAEIPPLKTPGSSAGTANMLKNPMLLLCLLSIFLGSASECTMTEWCSGYLEAALGISKLWGDVFGVAIFAATLGLGRTLYAKYGSNISKCLLLSFAGATVCYLTAALSNLPVLGLIACALTGICVAMLWPGMLILTAEVIPDASVAVYALLAAAGDFGAAAGPQIMGSVIDAVSAGRLPAHFPQLSAEQVGFKVGMLSVTAFPIIGLLIVIVIRRLMRIKSETRVRPSR